ncbi:MAG TPA: ribosome recycling factor [Thermodesulfobacteriota bacterium]|nr:ribosome recycling factor [Thermodesulfobacteriota bacterium]
MSVKGVYDETKRKMDKALDVFGLELAKLRTGRASVGMLDGVRVDYYGTPTPISQLATINVPEARLLVIQPWDVSQIQIIEKAVLSSGLGLTPVNDGKIIRIQIPALNEERRKELVKVGKKYVEECKVAIRNIRRESNEGIKKIEKEKGMSQDESKKAQAEIQIMTDKEIKSADEMFLKKEKEIMEV